MPPPVDPSRLLHPTLAVTPWGHVVLVDEADAAAVDAGVAERLREAFRSGAVQGMLALGLREVGTPLPPILAWWRELAARYVAARCMLPVDAAAAAVPLPSDDVFADLLATAPPMDGSEYLSVEILAGFWQHLDLALRQAVARSGESLQVFLKRHHADWNLVGRVCLHLAENRKDPDAPFAFLATYTTRLSERGTAQHAPLGRALAEYAGAADRERLLALLSPLRAAGEHCPWLAELVASQDIFHPLRWTVAEAVKLLRDVPHLERAGLVVRMPATWRANRPSRPMVLATVGSAPPSEVGRDALLDFSVQVALDGEPLSPAEVTALLSDTQGLAWIRGRWVEVDRERLERTLERFLEAERLAASNGLGFQEAMRWVAGAVVQGDDTVDAQAADWSQVSAGPWLAETLAGLRGPDGLAAVDAGPELHATLRPYQQVGLRWLYLLARLRLGACLADDMGLGKTIQLIALLLVLRRTEGPAPSLLVAPASLLANWADEIARFAPSLRVWIAHPSATRADALRAPTPDALAGVDLVVTTYGSLHRLAWLATTSWRLAVLDEAQAIKNPVTRQTKAAKALRASCRIALTGTPIENRLGDLWSLFDFINPGLLGTPAAFTRFTRRLEQAPSGFAPLRALVRPYVLRRLKSDRSVIADLPDKTEMTAYCGLSRTQAALYQQAVRELATAVEDAQGIQRKGLILSFLMRFKQICNHPSQWLQDGAWGEQDSGKFGRLREIASVVAAKREKMLVFSQFRETTEPLASFLGMVFGSAGLVLTGETAVARRRELVRRFQDDESIPFFVVSLKAGGSGLNLTAASHVVHFDRWWNPAVENQATDRAYRIGQSRNVLVHKFVCRGTVEERIDAMIASKQALAEDILAGAGEVDVTSLDDAALLELVRLDMNSAASEA